MTISPYSIENKKHAMSPTTRTASSRSATYSASSEDRMQRHMKMKNWISSKAIKCLQQRSDVDARETKLMYDRLLEREESFIQEVSSLVREKEKNDLRKKELLHKRWTERVHEPIRNRIITAMDSQGYRDQFFKKRELQLDYLEYVNKKVPCSCESSQKQGHAFLDNYSPDEYFPLGLHSSSCHARISMNRINDPLLSQQRARTAEEKIILRCQTGNTYSDKDIDEIRLPSLPLGRSGADWNKWQAMDNLYIESPNRTSCRAHVPEICAKAKDDTNASHFGFHNWGVKVHQCVVDLELKYANLLRGGHIPEMRAASQMARYRTAQKLLPEATETSSAPPAGRIKN